MVNLLADSFCTGDLVTMSDQDDLDMALATCKVTAAKERADMGKMEIWVQEI